MAQSSARTFHPPTLWLVIRYLQCFLSLCCIPYLAIAASTKDDLSSRFAQRLINTEGGWGYILTLSILGIYVLTTILSGAIFMCTNFSITPLTALIVDITFLISWPVALAGDCAAFIGYNDSKASSSRYSSIRNNPRRALILTGVFLVFFILGSIITTILSTRQLLAARKEIKRTAEFQAALLNASAATASPPTSPRHPYSRSSNNTNNNNRISTATTATYNTAPGNRSSEEEPKPEETTRLTREEVIAQRVGAVQAPPTYFYATSGRRREGAGDEESLPLYMP